MVTIELKEEIIAKNEREVCWIKHASMLTICTILKKKDEIKPIETKCVSRLSEQCTLVYEEMEKLLLWINEKQLREDMIMETIMCEKA